MIVEDFEKINGYLDYCAEFVYVEMDLKLIQQFFYFNKSTLIE